MTRGPHGCLNCGAEYCVVAGQGACWFSLMRLSRQADVMRRSGKPLSIFTCRASLGRGVVFMASDVAWMVMDCARDHVGVVFTFGTCGTFVRSGRGRVHCQPISEQVGGEPEDDAPQRHAHQQREERSWSGNADDRSDERGPERAEQHGASEA